MFQVQIGFAMAGSRSTEGLPASPGELRAEASPSPPSGEGRISGHGHGADDTANDDIWDDLSCSPDHGSILDRKWAYSQELLHKMGYRDGITKARNDGEQEGWNVGSRQGYKWGLVRGITSALASLPNSLKEKLLLDAHRRRELEDLHNSVREISAAGALQMFHESIHQDDGPPEESRLQTIQSDLLLLLDECPAVQVPEELTRVP